MPKGSGNPDQFTGSKGFDDNNDTDDDRVPEWQRRKREARREARRRAREIERQAARDRQRSSGRGSGRNDGSLKSDTPKRQYSSSQRVAIQRGRLQQLAAKRAEERRLQLELREKTKAMRDRLSAQNRHDSYEALAAKNRAILQFEAQAAQRKAAALKARQEGKEAEYARFMRERREFQEKIPSMFQNARAFGDTNQAVGRAQKTGDWAREMRRIKRDVDKTGGRYVDTETMEAVQIGYNEHVAAVKGRFTLMSERVKAAIKDKDYEKARKIFYGERYQNALAAYTELYGDGRKPGRNQEMAKLWTKIARRNDAWRQQFLTGVDLTPDEHALKRDMALVDQMRMESRYTPNSSNPELGGTFSTVRLSDKELQEKFEKIQKDILQASASYNVAKGIQGSADVLSQMLSDGFGWNLKNKQKLPGIFDTMISKRPAGYTAKMNDAFANGASLRGWDFESLKRDYEFGTSVQKGDALTKLLSGAIAYWESLNPKPGNVQLGNQIINREGVPDEVAGYKRPEGTDDATWAAQIQSLVTRGIITQQQYDEAMSGAFATGEEAIAAQAAGMSDKELYERDRDRFFNAAWRHLTGSSAPGPLEKMLMQNIDTPIIGDVLRMISIPVGVLKSSIRLAVSMATGNSGLAAPNVDFGAILETIVRQRGVGRPIVTWPGQAAFDSQNLLLKFDSSPARQAEEKAARDQMVIDVVRHVMVGDGIGALRVLAGYGEGTFSGNVSILHDTLLDPLTYGPAMGTVFSAGRAAISRGGGALNSMKNVDAVLTDFYRLIGPSGGMKARLLPKALEGYGDDGLKTIQWVNKVNRIVGTNFSDLGAFSKSDVQDLFVSILENKGNKLAQRNIIQDFFGKVPVDSEQLMVSVQNLADEMATLMNVNVTTAKELENLLKRQERNAARVAREEAGLAAESAHIKSLSTDAERAKLIRQERAARGQNVPQQIKAIPKGKVKDDIIREQRDVDAKISEWLQRTKDAADAAQILKTTTGTDMKSVQMRRDAIRKLRGSMDDVDRLAGPRGEIVMYRDAVYQNSVASGVSRRADHFASTAAQVTDDIAYVKGQMIQARQDLAAGVRGAKKRLRQLGSAERYYRAELIRVRGAAGVRDQIASLHGKEAKAALNPNRIAVSIRSMGDLVEETSRDLYRRFRGSEVDLSDTRAAATPVERQALHDAEVVLGSHMVDTRGVALQPHHLDLAGRSLIDAMRIFYPLYQKNRMRYGGAWNELVHQYDNVMRMNNVTGASAESIMDTLTRLHLDTGKTMTLQQYEYLDNLVQREHLKIFGPQSGVSRFVERKKPGGVRSVMRDENVQFLVEKHRVLKDMGYTISEYDEAGAVLRSIMVRRRTSRKLSKDTQAIVNATGRDFDEVFIEVRDKFMDQEAERQLGRFVERNWSEGMTAEDVFTLFAAKHLDSDLLATAANPISRYQMQVLENEFKLISGVTDAMDMKQVRAKLNQQNKTDVMSRTEFRAWLEKTGRWAPRTASAIREGKHVWSLAEEAKHFEHNYGFIPEWADEKIIAKVLDDPEAYKEFFEKHGYFDDGFEIQLASLKVEVDELRRVMAFGDGTAAKRGRTVDELREWAAQRYGTLVSDDGGKTLKSMPQLMDPTKGEYTTWIRNQVLHGKAIDPTLVKPDQLVAFGDAVVEAVSRRLERFAKEGYLEHGEEWLPQEQYLFALDVVSELKDSLSWRGFFKGHGMGHWGLNTFGWLMRVNILWNPAFGVMNMIELLTVKPLLLAIANGGMKFMRRPSEAARKAFPNLSSVVLERKSVWVTGRSGAEMARDIYLKRGTRIKAGVRAVFEAPAEISGVMEDRLKLGMAQRLFDDYYPMILKQRGGDVETAEMLTTAFVRDRVLKFFPSMDNASEFEKALNQLIPFFSYNFKNKVLGINIFLNHPWLLNLADNLGDELERMNAEAWAEEHPGEPLPDSRKLRQIWLRVGDDTLLVDLTGFSDWFRGPKAVFDTIGEDGANLKDMINQFVRIPHPQQNIMLAWLMGHEKSSDGIDATFENFFFPADFWKQFQVAWASQGDPVPWVQLMSKMLFFSEFKVLDPMQPHIDMYFTLRQAGMDQYAEQYLKDHPGMYGWFAEHRGEGKWKVQWGDVPPKQGFFQINRKNQSLIQDYMVVRQGFDDLVLRWDQKLEAIFDKPWTEEYRNIKKQRRLAIQAYIAANPMILDARASYMSPEDWVAQVESWAVDDQIDQYFAHIESEAPKRTDFKSDLEYAKARLKFSEWKKTWMKAHPAAAARLASGFTDVEVAWRQQEAHWSTILDENARYTIRILKEEAKAKPNSQLIRTLYDAQRMNWIMLDSESYVDIMPGTRNRASVNDALRDAGERGPARIDMAARAKMYFSSPKERVELPGFSDFMFDSTDDKGRAAIRHREWMQEKLEKVLRTGQPKDFWNRMRDDPKFFRAYLREHPDKRDDARYALGISGLFDRSSNGAEFYAGLAKDDWLRRRYFKEHPAARVRYEVAQRYSSGIQRIWARANASGDFDGALWGRLLDADPWLRRQYELRHGSDRGDSGRGSEYYSRITRLYRISQKAVDPGRAWWDGLNADPWLRRQYLLRNPDKQVSYRVNSAYSRHMGHWVSLLKADKFDEAYEYFGSMPAWVQERYLKNKRKDGDSGYTSGSFQGDTAYHGAMQKWIKLLEAEKYDEANKFFKNLPASIKEKYYEAHPDKRVKMELDSEQMALMSQYWLMPDDDPARLDWMKNHPELAQWIKEYADSDSERRAAIMWAYRNIAKGDAWMQRRLKERYPEIFSDEAVGQHKLDRVAEKLAENPELLAYYEKIVNRLAEDYADQLKREGALPKPIEFIYMDRWETRKKRRYIAMSRSTRRHLRLSA